MTCRLVHRPWAAINTSSSPSQPCRATVTQMTLRPAATVMTSSMRSENAAGSGRSLVPSATTTVPPISSARCASTLTPAAVARPIWASIVTVQPAASSSVGRSADMPTVSESPSTNTRRSSTAPLAAAADPEEPVGGRTAATAGAPARTGSAAEAVRLATGAEPAAADEQAPRTMAPTASRTMFLVRLVTLMLQAVAGTSRTLYLSRHSSAPHRRVDQRRLGAD